MAIVCHGACDEVIDSKPGMASTTTVDIEMPQMGESVTEGTVLEWHKSEGDFVEEGETLVEVSTDKVDAEVPAPASGTLTKILKQPDEDVKVGEVLAQLEPGEGSSDDGGASDDGDNLIAGGGEGDQDLGDDDAPSNSPQPGVEESPAPGGGSSGGSGESAELVMPEMGESVTEGTVLEWHKQEGESFAEGDTLVEVSTDKVDAEVPAPGDGTVTKILKQPDETVKVGEALAELSLGAGSAGSDPSPTATPAPTKAPGSDPTVETETTASGNGKSSPVARRVAAAKGVDLASVSGTGVGGKITKDDVLMAAGAAQGNGAAAAPAAAPPTEAETKPLRGPAGMLAKAMNESRSMPTATSFRTLPVDVLDAKRKALNGALKERGMKLSFTHLIAWAIVRAAAEDHPAMARTYAEDGRQAGRSSTTAPSTSGSPSTSSARASAA